MSKKIRKSLGEMLLENGVLSQEQWQEVQTQSSGGEPIRKILTRLQLISEEDMVNFIADHMEIPRIELNNQLIDSKVIDLVSEELARKHQAVPVLKIGNNLTCAMVDVFNIRALDELTHATGLTVEPGVATEQEINKALDEHYSVKGNLKEVIDDLDQEKAAVKDDSEIHSQKLKDMGEEPPVVKLVNMMIMQAVGERVSDIHIEPEEEQLNIRYRIDGILYEQSSPPKSYQSAIISRIKILANLDIAERRRPQDGRFQMKMEGRNIDIRVSCVPTIHGENVVLRLLDSGQGVIDLDKIGFNPLVLEKYKKMLSQPNGIILVTGPTGSGKTTTLYASLHLLNTSEKNIITIEDPVEYRLAGIRQIQVNAEIDLTFANGLRSILRQDPDIIMVGEIRDWETAQIAIQAALTGHLVLATLHTNNAPGAITRLLEMGIEPYLASSSVIGVIGQRLVRKICQECQGSGCASCKTTGYAGRIGIYEVMALNEELRRLIGRKASTDELLKTAVEAGMKTLKDDGLEKVSENITKEQEVFRVTQLGDIA